MASPTRKANRAILLPLTLIFIGVPVLGGFAVAHQRTGRGAIVGIGVLLWLGQMLAVYVYWRLTSKEAKKVSLIELFPTLLMSLMTFGLGYGLTVIFASRI